MGEPNPKHLRRSVTDALKSGHLHYERWAEIDDLLLDDRPQEASDLFAASVEAEPVYADVLGGQERWKPAGQHVSK